MFAALNSWRLFDQNWPAILIVVALGLALFASAHAILYKRDSRAAISWTGFIWLIPLGGAFLYFVFGINRIRRQAASLKEDVEVFRAHEAQPRVSPEQITAHLPAVPEQMELLARLVEQIVHRPLVAANHIDPLVNGDEVFPAMLQAIEQARHTIALETYIFDRDEVGQEFAAALGRARRRGVEVRVLIDAAGIRYSWPSILRTLRHEGVRYARFLPLLGFWRLPSMNLRTHRKLLICDGRIAFTGGINFRVGHCLERKPASPVQDIHFRVEGPVVTQMQEVFAEDWQFSAGERLRGEHWFPALVSRGKVLARGVADGPDEDFENFRWLLLGALSVARSSVQIVTPYFLPDSTLISSLNLAAMRGVRVDIIIPERSNLRFVDWASRALWWQILKHGCRIWLTPPPFDHSKLMVVDGCWSSFGSANWDARSLRLNFEFNLECYDAALGKKLSEMAEAKRARAREVTLEEIDARGLAIRLRDGIARLGAPYL
jgi:cardiolipin synthase